MCGGCIAESGCGYCLSTLQCLDGSKFEVAWPAKMKRGAKLDLRKLAAKAHPATVLGDFRFRLTNSEEGFADLVANEADMAMTLREVERM